jgi:hypothetical protein
MSSINGCSLFKKKSFEDTDTYKEMIKNQKETDKKIDSIRNAQLNREMDSLRRTSDSLSREIDKSMENLKKSQEELNKKMNKNK